MTKTRTQKLQLVAFNLAEKHQRYGYTSLKTLSTWNDKVNPSEEKGFTCHKETHFSLIDIWFEKNKS